MLLALGINQNSDRLGDGIAAAPDALDLAAQSGRNHDLMENGAGLLDRADDIAGGELVTGLRHSDKIPLLITVQRRDVRTAGDAVAGQGAQLGQRALDSVVDIVQHAGSEFDGHRHSGGNNIGSGTKAGGFFINLDGSLVPCHIQDLTDQAAGTDAHHVRDVGIRQAFRHDKRSGYFGNFSAHLSNFLS